MSHHRKKFLSAGLAGVLCSTALFGVDVAHADGRNNLHLPGLRDRPHTPENSFTRMFPELPPFAKPPDDVRQQAQKMGEKGGVCDALDNLTDPITDETVKVCAYNFPPKGHFPRKAGDYREHATHYLMVGSVSRSRSLCCSVRTIPTIPT